MVATSGRGWSLAPSLIRLIDEADARWPDRSTASDGSIGDPAHSSRTSDHNPDASGDVLAVDITEDDNGPDLVALWDHLVASRDGRVKYLIYERRIVKSYRDSAGRPPWVRQPYTGVNAHAHHLHVSILDAGEARDSTAPWFPQEDDMPLTPDDINAVEAAAERGATKALDKGTAEGQIGWPNTSKATLAGIQGLHNLENANTAKVLQAVGVVDDEIIAGLTGPLVQALKDELPEIEDARLEAAAERGVRNVFADAATPDPS